MSHTSSVQASSRPLHVAPLLAAVAAQAADADIRGTLANEVLEALKQNAVSRLSASASLNGLDGSIVQIGRELEAVAAACASTAWCLWNHLAVFHLGCGVLGSERHAQLRDIVDAGQWICFPAGAGSAVLGHRDANGFVLRGRARFASNARYADHAAIVFADSSALPQRRDLHFAIVSLHQERVRIDPNWHAMSLRASATDDLYLDGVHVPIAHSVPFPPRYREPLRTANYPHIHRRYAEDWVALSDLWLGCMAVGIVRAALQETCKDICGRIGIAQVTIAERPTVHVRLGETAALVDTAESAVYAQCAATDARIAAGTIPTETHYLQQTSAGMMAMRLCADAMRNLLTVMGGNGLREGPTFARRYRDLLALPLHINAHPDRLTEQYGRHCLGLPTENTF